MAPTLQLQWPQEAMRARKRATGSAQPHWNATRRIHPPDGTRSRRWGISSVGKIRGQAGDEAGGPMVLWNGHRLREQKDKGSLPI